MGAAWTTVLVAALATLVGASVQGSIGFGMNLVVVPVLALVIPDALPATAVLLGIPLSIAMTRHERHAVDRPGLVWITAGRVPGTVIGTLIVASVSIDVLKGFIGVFVLLSVAISALAPPIPLRPSTQFAGGLESGVTGTAAGIGGPPLAILYQHHPGPTMRATLAASFLIGTFLSLAALGIAGEVRGADIVLALVLIPVVLLGARIGRLAHNMLDRAWLRPAVLTFAAISAAVVLLDAMF
jgi:uncharacterized membrane protein YfcA